MRQKNELIAVQLIFKFYLALNYRTLLQSYDILTPQKDIFLFVQLPA